MVLPDYRKAAQRLNQAVSSSKNDSPVERYTRLGRLVRLCGRGIRLIIVAMPLPAVYPIDDQLVRTLVTTTFRCWICVRFGEFHTIVFSTAFTSILRSPCIHPIFGDKIRACYPPMRNRGDNLRG